MGGVYLWNKNRDSVLATDLYETLTRPRGLNEMDEYVLESIGIGFTSPNGKDTARFLTTLSGYCMVQTVGDKTDFTKEEILRAAKSMYIFGMIFEKDRLGIK